jgi:hypothetical protein
MFFNLNAPNIHRKISNLIERNQRLKLAIKNEVNPLKVEKMQRTIALNNIEIKELREGGQ